MTVMQAERPTPTTSDRDTRINENLALVKYCVNSMHLMNSHSGLDYEDLVALGTVGLVQAADRFDDSRGVKFASYAMTRIRGAVIDGLRTLDPVGRSSRDSLKKIAEGFNTLALELGHYPTAAEVRANTGLSHADYWSARRAGGLSLVSLETPATDGSNLADRLSDGAPEVSAAIEGRELTAALAHALRRLPDRDRLVLQLYYVEGLTMKGVAAVLDLSETRISQLMNRAYARLRADRGLIEAA
ncbi:MAG: sigma-70 family RNA polymerase sigma factor [bacterium]